MSTISEAFKALNGKKTLKEAFGDASTITLDDFYASPEWEEFDNNFYYGYSGDSTAILRLWDSVDKVKEFSSRNTYNKLLKDQNAILVLFYGDIGDGHGDMVNYIFSRNGNLYVINDSSNALYMANIEDYSEFKDAVTRDEFWQDMYLTDLNNIRFDSSCLSLEPKDKILNTVYALIDNDGNIDNWNDEDYISIEYDTNSRPFLQMIEDGLLD